MWKRELTMYSQINRVNSISKAKFLLNPKKIKGAKKICNRIMNLISLTLTSHPNPSRNSKSNPTKNSSKPNSSKNSKFNPTKNSSKPNLTKNSHSNSTKKRKPNPMKNSHPNLTKNSKLNPTKNSSPNSNSHKINYKPTLRFKSKKIPPNNYLNKISK